MPSRGLGVRGHSHSRTLIVSGGISTGSSLSLSRAHYSSDTKSQFFCSGASLTSQPELGVPLTPLTPPTPPTPACSLLDLHTKPTEFSQIFKPKSETLSLGMLARRMSKVTFARLHHKQRTLYLIPCRLFPPTSTSSPPRSCCRSRVKGVQPNHQQTFAT